MRIKDIVNLNYDDMGKLAKTPEKLLDITKQAFQYASTRRTRSKRYLEKLGINTTQTIMKEDIPYWDYDFNQKRLSMDMDYGEYTNLTNLLLHELKIAKDFLSAKTSLASGWVDTMKKFARRVKDITAIKIDENDFDVLWQTYNAVVKSAGSIESMSYDSTQLQKIIYDTMLDESLSSRLGLNSASSTSERVEALTEYLKDVEHINYIDEMERERKELEKYSEGITIKGRGRRR